MRRRKMATYRAHLPCLARAGIWYMPMVWSAFGRAHPEAERALESMARAAAVRRGFQGHHLVLRRARANIGVKLARRAVWMVRACLVRPCDEELAGLCSGACAQAPRTRVVRQLAEGFTA